MIKFKIGNEDQKPKRDHEIGMWLSMDGDDIVLEGRNTSCEMDWTILRITSNGFLLRDSCCGIDGLQKDEDDTIIEKGE